MATPGPRYKQNRLQQLRGFCYAAESGSISKAARRMLLRQPSVSLQIQALEREFKVSLFERSGPRISLTPEGKLLYELAAPLVEQMDELQESFTARRETIDAGCLNIAAGESTILYILPRFVRDFAAEYPAVELRLHNVTGRDGLAMLRAGEVDLAVGSLIDIPTDVHYLPAFTYDPMLITARDHPLAEKPKVTIEEISRYPLILPPRHLTTWQIVDMAFRQRGLKYEVRLEAGGWEVIKKYVEMGLGISIVTSICLTGQENLAARPVNEYFPQRTYGIVLRKGRALSTEARRFIELMDPTFQVSAVAPGGAAGQRLRDAGVPENRSIS